MKQDFTTEQLEKLSRLARPTDEKGYTPRPKWQTVFAMALAVIVFLAFLGTCYWMIFGRF